MARRKLKSETVKGHKVKFTRLHVPSKGMVTFGDTSRGSAFGKNKKVVIRKLKQRL